jgi:excisionase family DNA binding protein
MVADPHDIKLLTLRQAAEALQVSESTVRGYVKDGSLPFVNKGRGAQRPRLAFDPADIEDFKRNRKRRLTPCHPSTRIRKANTGRPTSGSTVVSFLAQRKERQNARRALKQTASKES